MDLKEAEARHTREAVEDEIRAFEERASRFLRGEITDDQFRPFRLKHGTYGQRQPGMQMLRVKIPSGILNAEQLEALADIADTHSTGRGHVTTRENVQFHFVNLGAVGSIMRQLADNGLTTREACGNTVRNVTSCPLAGVCSSEAFDVTPFALATTSFFLRHPEFHDLPRKFKIAFSGCKDDGHCSVAGIHDIGVVAVLDENGRRGFKILVGGGLGSLPTESAPLTGFLPEDELLPTIEAILRVFNRDGVRGNKHKARLKFMLRAKGIEELRRLVSEERARLDTPPQSIASPSPVRPPLVSIQTSVPALNGDSADYQRWAQHNFRPQRQAGYGVVWIKLPAGTVLSKQFRGLAGLLRKHKLSAVRIAVSQDLVIPWVPLNAAVDVFRDLRALDLATPGAGTIADVTGCPGATTCNLGITRSLTLAEVLAEEFAGETDPEVQKVRVKISGCPNSCGHHHIADIGLYGNARKIGDTQAPFYQLLLGGRVSADGVRFGRQVMTLPAKTIPDALRDLLEFYKDGRLSGESFGAWVERTPERDIVSRLDTFNHPQHSRELFIDWGDNETYSLKLGRGECSA